MNRPDPSNEATVILRRESLVGPVLGRVIGMLAARADAPVDRLDDVLLVSDAIAAHGPSHAEDGAGLQVHIQTTQDELVLRIGPLAHEGGKSLLAAADLPGVGNVLEQVSEQVTVEPGAAGEHLVILVSLSA